MTQEQPLAPESIKRWRESRGITQQQLADMLRVGVASIIRWEKGSAEPSGSAAAILEALITSRDPEKDATRKEMVAKFGKTAGIAGVIGVAGLPLAGMGLASYGIFKLLKETWEPESKDKKCSSCGAEIPSDSVFCKECGKKIK